MLQKVWAFIVCDKSTENEYSETMKLNLSELETTDFQDDVHEKLRERMELEFQAAREKLKKERLNSNSHCDEFKKNSTSERKPPLHDRIVQSFNAFTKKISLPSNFTTHQREKIGRAHV